MTQTRKLAIFFALLAIVAVAMSLLAKRVPSFPADLYLTRHIQSLNSEPLTSLSKVLAFLFESWRSALIVIGLAALAWWRSGKLSAFMMLAAGASTLAGSLLKVLVARPRPSPDLVHVLLQETGYGFPSGHAVFAIIVLGMAACLLATRIRDRLTRTLLVAVVVLVVLLVGTSRVYLGVHWPSDVVGGYLVGGAILAALVWFYRTAERMLFMQPAP